MTTVNNFIDKISNEQTALLPAVEFRGEIRIVEHERDIAAACKTLAEQPVIGFDTETRPSFRPGVTFRVSLLQLSTPTVCYLFRLNKIPLAKPILQLLSLIHIFLLRGPLRRRVRRDHGTLGRQRQGAAPPNPEKTICTGKRRDEWNRVMRYAARSGKFRPRNCPQASPRG